MAETHHTNGDATLDDVERYGHENKRRVAVHEAGHAIVAVAMGWDCSARLIPQRWSEELTTWAGDCFYLPKIRHDPRRVETLCQFPVRNAIVASAGMVAEILHEDPAATGTSIQEATDWRHLSPEDRAGIKAGLARFKTERRIYDEAARILREHLTFWQWATAELMEHERIAHEVLRERFNNPPEQKTTAPHIA